MEAAIIFSGRGGQGIGAMGKVLALTAVAEGKEVASSPSYGGEVTGGLSQSEVIISDGKIDFPAVLEPDILVVLAGTAVAPPGKRVLIFYDTDLVESEKLPRGQGLIAIAATKMAVEIFGEKKVANMIMLGAFVAVTGIVEPESVVRVIHEEFGGKNPELSAKAFIAGLTSSKRS